MPMIFIFLSSEPKSLRRAYEETENCYKYMLYRC